ncbi:polysaccharide deacetylase family protein [Virgibacillus sp. W0430]|uniref:polysaccharide deacetylase family protein n=1 Tax=Virgibacillus sp. W0430 TaxID=3391580 RepID=UPI003F484180
MKRQLLTLFIPFLLIACSEQQSTEQQNEKTNPNQQLPSGEKELREEKVDKVPEVETEEQEAQQADEKVNQNEDNQPKYKINTTTWFIQPLDEKTNEQVVLLTIDDAPNTYALEMAKTLKKLEAQAIFFVNGHFLETDEEKEILKEIHNMGFAIGNHTYSHEKLPNLSEAKQREEIIHVSDMVESIIGERPKYFRAPFGLNTDYSEQLANEEDMLLMNWSYGYDWDKKYMTREAIADIMVNAPELANGANLLMHDRKWTAEALESIVKGLRDKGYEIIDPALIQTE